MVPIVFWLGQHTQEQHHYFVGVLPWVAGQQLDLDVELEVILLKEEMFYCPISNEGEQQVSIPVSFPSSHHDECSDHDHVLGFERHENGTLIAIVIVILIWIGRGV